MLQAVATLLTVELIGLAAFPLVARAFPVLTDKGWAISKPLGLLLVATSVWLVSHSQVIPNSPGVWWIATGVLALISLRIVSRDNSQLRKTLARRWKIFLTTEILFIVFFALFLTIRAFDPAASGTEKPMDLMMLNAVTSSAFAPPQDLWLAGEPIAYYYFGYWIYGGVNAMTGVGASVAYNVGIALVGGLAASVIFSLVATLVQRDGGRIKDAVAVGGASTVLLLLVSNLTGLWTLLDITRFAPTSILNWYHGHEYDRVEKIVTWRPDDFWWWWKSSRITNTFSESGQELDFTIQEFPFFSFLLGDFHPHLMSIPFLLTGITVLTATYIGYRTVSFSDIRRNIPGFLLVAVAIGSAGFINFWDVGLLLLLSIGLWTAGWVAAKNYGLKSLVKSVLPLIAIWLVGVIIYSPFYFGTAESQVQWPPIAPVEYGTRPIHLLSIWVLLLIVVIPVIAVVAAQIVRSSFEHWRRGGTGVIPSNNYYWKSAWLTAAALTAVPWLLWALAHLAFNESAQVSDVFTRLPVTGLLGVIAATGIAVVITRARRGADDAAQFVLVLATLGIYLLYAAELFFVHDLFGNRMNTVFKFYYQGWILFSIAGGYGIYMWLKVHPRLTGRNKLLSRTGIAVVSVLAITSIYFPAAAGVTKTVSSGLGPTLDSLSFLEDRNADELEVIEEIRELARRDDVLAEAVGGSYTDFGRISETTGVPTIIGWTFHQTQWHGSNELFADREEDVRTLYSSQESDEIQEVIDKYGVTLVVVGPRERSTYGNTSMRMFDTLGDRIIEHGSYTVFRIEN